MAPGPWSFVHNAAADAKWTPGLREIFEYRDLGIKTGTGGDYVAHVIRHNGRKVADAVQQWHVHDCTFQLVYVLNGWATFEYEGQGVVRCEPGTCVYQPPMIRHRDLRSRPGKPVRHLGNAGGGDGGSGLRDPVPAHSSTRTNRSARRLAADWPWS